MRKMTCRGTAQQAALLITLPTMLLTSTLCVAQTRGSQATANVPRALRLSLRIESQSRADPAGGVERTATDVQIDYTCNLLPSKRVVAIDRFRRTANAGAELQNSADLQRPRAVLYVQGRRREIPFENADDKIREVLAALEAPAYEVVLDADGAETSRRVLPTPEALALMSDDALWNTRFFHVPFHVDRDTWECERTLGAGVEASGTLRYQKTASPRSDGLIEVRVEGSLRGRTERDGTEEVETFEVSGTQSYDPSCHEWVAGELVMKTRLTSREDERRIRSGSGTTRLTLTRQDSSDSFRAGAREVRFTQPEGWKLGARSAFREVDFEVDGRTRCHVAVLAGDAGGVLANVNRWRREMSLEPLDVTGLDALPRAQVLGVAAIEVSLDGDHSGLMGSIEDARLLGVICPLADCTVFVKMVGPRESVRQNETRFAAFWRSMRALVDVVDAPTTALSEPPAARVARLMAEAEQRMRDANFTAAIGLLDQVLAENEPRADALYMRASAKGQLRNHEGAIADATRAIELSPGYYAAYVERGYNHAQRREWQLAVADFDRAIALQPDEPMAHGERADMLIELGELLPAIAAYDRAIELAPRWPQAYAGRGTAAQTLGDFESARQDFLRATQLAPNNPWFFEMRASTEFDCRRDADALRSARTFSRLSPSSLAGVKRGRLAWRIGEFDVALEILREAGESENDGVAANALLSAGCILLAREDFAAAAIALDAARARTIPPLTFWILAMRWCAESATEDLERAGDSLERACRDQKLELTPTEQAVLAICTRGDGDDGSGSDEPWIGKPDEACPRLFFAAWRADRQGQTERSNRLFAQCVNTGAKAWQQWATAVSILQRRVPAERRSVSLGATFVPLDGDESDAAVRVEDVVAGGAAHRQGLRRGDLLVGLAGRGISGSRWAAAIDGRREGHDLRVDVRRDGETFVLELRLGIGLRD